MPKRPRDRYRTDIPPLSNPFQEFFPITADKSLGARDSARGEVPQRVLHEFEKRRQPTATCGAELQGLAIHFPRVRVGGRREKLESLRSEGFEGTRFPLLRQKAESSANRTPAEPGSSAGFIRSNLTGLHEEPLDTVPGQGREVQRHRAGANGGEEPGWFTGSQDE
jgi:hypothetical protein